MDAEASNKRYALADGAVELPRIGSVIASRSTGAPYEVAGADGGRIEPVDMWVRDLMLCDRSPRTVRAYCYSLLTWFRILWHLDVRWDAATESDVAAMVGWLRSSINPQRARQTNSIRDLGAVNAKTGKPSLGHGYSPSTINVALAAVYQFYSFHEHFGRGPLVNPVPQSPQRRRALAHRSPIESRQRHRRARLRQKSVDTQARSIPDELWSELFAVLRCPRDRALLLCYVTSGARASELLGCTADDVDWAHQRIWVISKGTRLRRPVPVSPEALMWLAAYLDNAAHPGPSAPLWRTLRKPERALTYSAARRVLQRANTVLGTNWTLHDLRHTAAVRMVSDGTLTLPEIQTVLGHADLRTTSRYTVPRLEEMVESMAAFYARPAPPVRLHSDYDPTDFSVVFGA
ncbi:MAG: integrase [Gordonia sp. (in: high G+C Gram-positive bacteria)]|nr:MAG: integrase [Gordonia sp. (in: high G+C Gram-positive bacteria)]